MFFCVRTVSGMPRVWLWCIVALAFVQNIGNIGSVEDSILSLTLHFLALYSVHHSPYSLYSPPRPTY